MASIAECSGCRSILGNDSHLGCCTCGAKYDLVCANVASNIYDLMDADHKASWKCPECCSKEPKTGNINTPVRSTPCLEAKTHEEEALGKSNVTIRKRPTKSPLKPSQKPLKTSQKIPPKTSQKTTLKPSQNSPPKIHPSPDSQPRSPLPVMEPAAFVTENRLREILQQEISTAMNSTIKQIVATEFKNIHNKIDGFRDSLEFMSNRYEEMKSKFEGDTAIITELKCDNEHLKTTVRDLATRLNIVELHMRESNLEINGIPESRSESLVTTIVQLSKVVESALTSEDIQHAVRVAKISNDNSRPRPVIVKLRNPRFRDSILAAVTKFNHKDPEKKLCTQHLGIGGPVSPVYVSEHLTPALKSLHAATRIKAREMSYKFVWVRNGRIFVRKTEEHQAIAIKNVDSLKLLV